jgi:hypothetical protein
LTVVKLLNERNALPEAERIAIREEVRLAVGDKGGPVIIDQNTWFARGIR